MKFDKIIEFGKDEVSTRFLVETDTPKPIGFMDIKMVREFNNITTTRPNFPLRVDVIGNDNLHNELQKLLNIQPRIINSKYYQMVEGYIIGAYNIKNKKFKLNRALTYHETLPSTHFNNDNYIIKNPLDHLERDLDGFLDDDSYDYIFFFLIGDNLDFFNGYKYIRSESNIDNKKLFKIDDSQTMEPLAFMKKYNSNLNVNKLVRDAVSNRVENNKLLSHPLDYFISYFGKICTQKREIVEEVYTYNRKGRNDGNMFIKSILNVGDNKPNLKPVIPFENNYPLSPKEEYYKGKGCDVLYGFDYHIPYNVFKYPLDISPPNREVIDFWGKKHIMTCLFKSNNIDSENKFEIPKGISLSEIKEADQ